MDRRPPVAADPVAEPVRHPEHGDHPAGDHAQAGPDRPVVEPERHHERAGARVQPRIEQQEDAVRRDRHERGQRDVLVRPPQRDRHARSSPRARRHRQAEPDRRAHEHDRDDARRPGRDPPAVVERIGRRGGHAAAR